MEEPIRRRFPWRSNRPRIARYSGDAPLSPAARFDYRLALIAIAALGVWGMALVVLARH